MASQFPNDPSNQVPPPPPPPPSYTPPPPPPPPPSMTPPPTGGGMIGRIQRLVLSTASEWQAIDADPIRAQPLFMRWAVPLAAIPPVAAFVGFLLFVGTYFLTSVIVSLVLLYALFLASAWGLAMVIDGMAPNFGSTKSFDQAMKASVYSFVPFWIAGILNVIPQLAPVALVIGLFGLFLMWIGLPIVMKTPADKAPAYVAISGLIAVVLIFASYKITEAVVGAMVRSSVVGGFGGLS